MFPLVIATLPGSGQYGPYPALEVQSPLVPYDCQAIGHTDFACGTKADIEEICLADIKVGFW